MGACGGGSSRGDDGRTSVVAAFFPLADAARVVGGANVDVVDLTPKGVEPHDLEVTSKTIDRLQDADVVLVLGGGFQPSVEKAASRAHTVRVLDRLGLSSKDPHVWLDPTIYSKIVGIVGTALHADPLVVQRYRATLAALDAQYSATLSTCTKRVLVSSHDAYGYLARRYRLQQESITGLVPEEEPDPARLDVLSKLVASDQVTTVFNEPLLPKRAAETLAREAHVTVATLDPLESDGGASYVRAMKANLRTLAKGLDCTLKR